MQKLLPGIIVALIMIFMDGCGATHEIEWNQPFRELLTQSDNGNAGVTVGKTQYDRYFLCEGSRFWYQTLTDAEKLWYRDMENILGSMEQKQLLSQEGLEQGLKEEDIDRIFQCVMMDHPELFFVDGYVYSVGKLGEKVENLFFSGSYRMDRSQATVRKAEIEMQTSIILNGVSKDADDYEKIKYVYETLIRRTDYDLDAPDNQNIYSVLVGNLSVCQGYAKATQYLLNQLGVECTLVSGTVQGGNLHGWNLVKSNGDYYYLDTTWGDASYNQNEEGEMEIPTINYDYLCVTTEELLKTHRFEDFSVLPECVALKDNYYVREGAYFTDFDEAKLRILFAHAQAKDYNCVTLKCSTQSLYEQVKEKLIDEGNIFQYYNQITGTVVYVQNEEQFSLTFWVTNS